MSWPLVILAVAVGWTILSCIAAAVVGAALSLLDGPSDEFSPVAGVGGSPPPAPVVFLDDVRARRRPERTIA